MKEKTKLNYLKLKDYLIKNQWKLADLQTRKLMLNITGADKRQDILLTQNDLNNFPCEHLILINNLWQKQSHNHFGFTIINQIYLDCNQDYKLLAKKVGWYHNNEWIKQEKINFSLEAPQGHLPLSWLIPKTFSVYWCSRFASAGWGLLLNRINQCDIKNYE
ncbi:GUN4 domain-containing protein [Geminocystis sp. NIES-3709]|uniref:GUN4 domain-containing protein n=1 Tax=Geminocystis sp. NIES-3709 TaxID=1617448 RepID=UPI0005FCD170|nr:GUN4 domain-containing protein [Geminocystis sp. NIES-3709]BAQ64988.1 serine/threonine kinase [Geminocystis sp. NIES-3709]